MKNIRQTTRATAGLLVLALLGGCATLSESECRGSDWYDVGFRDGRQGYPEDRINEHVKACAEYGLAPERDRYRDGRLAGLESYCTPHNGLAVGRSGSAYYGVCIAFEERPFMAGYSLGNALYRAHQRLAAVNGEIARTEAQLKEKDVKEEVRVAAIYRRVQLEGERGAALSEVDRLEYEAQTF
jgi:hypothetical protein